LIYDWPVAFRGLRRLLSDGADACAIFGILGILSSGHVAMCGIGIQVADLCYGLLGKDSIADVWTIHPRLVELRNNLPKNLQGICSECLFRNRCLGSCIAGNYNHTGNLAAPFWFCQEAVDENLFPFSRR